MRRKGELQMKKRLLSFILAVVLLIQCPGASVYAIDNNSFNGMNEMQENELQTDF